MPSESPAPSAKGTQPSEPLSPPVKGAHELVTLLRSTIATQRLPYQHGTEAAALESLHRVFVKAREIVIENPDAELAARVMSMLNRDLRPFMARWHRLSEKGGLNSRDGGDAFCGELRNLQDRLRICVRDFYKMAYGETEWNEDNEKTPPAIGPDALIRWFTPLRYGILKDEKANGGIPQAKVTEINQSEASEVEARRGHAFAESEGRPNEGVDAVGLAFSGGGIRSATFCLGVAQVLADKNLTPQVDYLSTVSGGGYTGGFLARRMGEESSSPAELGGALGPDPPAIRFLRRRAKYLAAPNLWTAWGMVMTTVAGMLVNWMVPLVAIMVAALLSMGFKREVPDDGVWWKVLGISLILFFIAICVFFSSMKRRGRWTADREGKRIAIFGIVVLGAGLLGLIDWAYDAALGLGPTDETWPDRAALWRAFEESPFFTWTGWKTFGFGGLLALVPAFLRYMPVLKSPKVRKWLTVLCLVVAALVIPLLGIAAYYACCAIAQVEDIGIGYPAILGGGSISGLEVLALAALVFAVVIRFVLDINLTSPLRIYRQGIRNTFVSREDNEAGDVLLSSTNATQRAPYHLINCTANLPSSEAVKLRERQSDFFLFSKHFIGSPTLGYNPTGHWKMSRDEPDLATAVAISGAAFSSHMGLGSKAPLRALLTFLNVRLGYWIRRPSADKPFPSRGSHHPGFLCLLREMTGLRMSEKQRWINISDGGHIENLATYELLRRRCKFIVCVDGEADPDLSFHGFMTLVRHAQIDFGVRIDADLSDIRPDPKTGLSRSHYQLCPITYPSTRDGISPAGTGLLLYVKLSVTGNESELIKRYRGTHPEFPHQTTLDQFFDEEQFEAYRQLGAHVASGLFAQCLMEGGSEPNTMNDWFRRLAGSLLEHEQPKSESESEVAVS